jgi:tetratricopeptide (TPR) repeat protein
MLASKPDDPVALNNLAYHLATREQKPAEALALAERAYALSRNSTAVTDTLAWILHLLGKHAEATKYITEALKQPVTPDILVHAAVIFEAGGRIEDAQKALQKAVSVDPSLATRDDVRAIQEKLKGKASK